MRWIPVPFTSKILVSFILMGVIAASFVVAANISTSVITTSAVVTIAQDRYRWYGNIDALDPSSTLAAENVAVSVPAAGTVLRLRMNVNDGGVQLDPGNTFLLQYANSTSGPWTNLSTSTAWVFFDNPSVADGQIVVNALLGASDVGESYGESNPSAASPTAILPTQDGEWDWAIENNSAATANNWFFRMIYASGTFLDFYNNYPALAAVPPPTPPPPPGGGVIVGVGGGGGSGYFATSSPNPPLPVPPPILPPVFQVADFNGDNHIDIVDFSILLYYYNETGPDAVRYDLDGDGTVDFPDVSILMYYWTE